MDVCVCVQATAKRLVIRRSHLKTNKYFKVILEWLTYCEYIYVYINIYTYVIPNNLLKIQCLHIIKC